MQQQLLRARWPVMASRTARPVTARPFAPAPRRCRRVALCRATTPGDDEQAATASTATSPPAALTTADFEETATPPPGCSRYTVSIKKPLGLVLEQDTTTLVLRVAELSPEGAAEKAGVGIGDQLIAVSGVTYDRSEAYGEVQVKKGQQRVRLSARGETLKTIGAAISSHPGNWEVTLEFQRCER